MRPGKSLVGQQLKASQVAPVTPEQKVEDIIAMIVPCARQRTRVPAGNDFEFRKWRIAGEIFIGINRQILGMVNGQQPYLIQVDYLFQRFHQTKTQKTVPWLQVFAIYLDVFSRVRNVALAWTDPMAYDAGAQHISDETVARAVPNPEYRARAPTAVNFRDFR